MKRSYAILCTLCLFLLFAFAAAPARAQYVYGITALQLDPDLGQVYGYSATALDYAACYYYDAAVVGTLYEGSTAIDGGSYHGVCAAEVYTDGVLRDDFFYTQFSEHYIIAYYYYYYYGFYDPYGFNYFGSGDHGGGFNYYGYYGPYYFAQSNYDLGDTHVTLFNQGPCDQTPVLNVSAASVVRGTSATFSLAKVCSTASVRDWSFTEGANTVNRGSSAEKSWSGMMVTSGTVRVTVEQGGRIHNLSKSITVNPRSDFAFTAKTATKKANGSSFKCGDLELTVPDPPDGRVSKKETLGRALTCLRYSWNFGSPNSGPNQGYRYITDVNDTTTDNSVNPKETTFAWTITPQLEDPTSEFYRAQCGRDGFISGAQLLTNVVGHESGAKNSHYSRYVEAQNKQSNNIKAGLEAIVGPSTETEDAFKDRVKAEGDGRLSRIKAASEEEPCGESNVRKDENCKEYGVINYTPYQPCSPLSLQGQAAGSSRVNLSWTDGSFNETGFRVERREGADPTFYTVTTTAAGVTSYPDTSVQPSKTYSYRVVAVGETKSSPPSNEVAVAVPGINQNPPTQPSNLSGSAAASTLINLFWTDSSGDEEGFKIERSVAGGGFSEIASVGAGVTSFSDASVAANTTYTYQVRAWSAAGSSAPSAQLTVTTPPVGSPPGSPCCLWGQSYQGAGSITLWWNDMSNDESSFTIERNDGWGGDFYAVGWVSANTTTATDYGLQQGQTYIYRIVAENPYGQSYSEELYYTVPYWWEQ